MRDELIEIDFKAINSLSRSEKVCIGRKYMSKINKTWNNLLMRRFKNPAYNGERSLTKVCVDRDDLTRIWYRDNAEKMDRPSLDRIDPEGHYTLDNIRFIEIEENWSGKRRRYPRSLHTHCRRGHKFTDETIYTYENGDKSFRTCDICIKQNYRNNRYGEKHEKS